MAWPFLPSTARFCGRMRSPWSWLTRPEAQPYARHLFTGRRARLANPATTFAVHS
jgi:hypothetical protein